MAPDSIPRISYRSIDSASVEPFTSIVGLCVRRSVSALMLEEVIYLFFWRIIRKELGRKKLFERKNSCRGFVHAAVLEIAGRTK